MVYLPVGPRQLEASQLLPVLAMCNIPTLLYTRSHFKDSDLKSNVETIWTELHQDFYINFQNSGGCVGG